MMMIMTTTSTIACCTALLYSGPRHAPCTLEKYLCVFENSGMEKHESNDDDDEEDGDDADDHHRVLHSIV